MNVQSTADTLTMQYRFSSSVFNMNLADITDESALLQPSAGGNCMNWIAGHVLHFRGVVLGFLGQSVPYSATKYDRYQRATEPVSADGEGVVALSEMLVDFAASDEALQAGLAGLTDELLSAKASFGPGAGGDKTVGYLTASLVFHEAYHSGQLGELRYLAGEKGAIK